MSRILTITNNGFETSNAGISTNLTHVKIGVLSEVLNWFHTSLDNNAFHIGSRPLGLNTNTSDWDYIIPVSKFSSESFVGKCFHLCNDELIKTDYSWLPEDSKLYTLEFYETYDLKHGFPYGHEHHKIQLLVLTDEEFEIQVQNNLKVKHFLTDLFDDSFGGWTIKEKLLYLKTSPINAKFNPFYDDSIFENNTESYKSECYFVPKKITGLGSLFFKTVLWFIENPNKPIEDFLEVLKVSPNYSYKVFPLCKESTDIVYWGVDYAKPILEYLKRYSINV